MGVFQRETKIKLDVQCRCKINILFAVKREKLLAILAGACFIENTRATQHNAKPLADNLDLVYSGGATGYKTPAQLVWKQNSKMP